MEQVAAHPFFRREFHATLEQRRSLDHFIDHIAKDPFEEHQMVDAGIYTSLRMLLPDKADREVLEALFSPV